MDDCRCVSLGVCGSASWGAGTPRILMGTRLTMEKGFMSCTLTALRSNHSQMERWLSLCLAAPLIFGPSRMTH